MNRRMRNTTIAVIGTAFLILILQVTGVVKLSSSFFEPVINPIGRVIYSTSQKIRGGVGAVFSVTSIARDNENLRSQVNDLKKQLVDLKEVQKENEQLRAQLNFAPSNQYELIAAKVIGSDPDTVRTVLQIDRGTSSGLAEGMAVISNGALVGIVDSVSKFSAKVLAVNDPVFKITALTQDSRADGVIRGQLGTGLKMERISQNVQVKDGETVITAGSGLVPKGIRIGEVENVEHADNAIFQAANVASAVKINSLEIVFIVSGIKE